MAAARAATKALSVGLAWLVSATALAQPVPSAPSAGPDTYQESQCCDNEKSIGLALEVYSAEHAGHYPQALSQLVPRYLRELPLCPTGKKDTYSATYQVRTEPDRYRFYCQGRNHFSPDLPAYSSEQGLIRGPEAEQAAQSSKPYFPNVTAGLEADNKPSNHLSEDYNDGVDAVEEQHYDKAESIFKRVLDSAQPDSQLTWQAHGGLVLVYAFKDKPDEADAALAALQKLGSKPEVADDICSDLSRAADQWYSLKDPQRAEKLHHLAVVSKASPNAIAGAQAQYALFLESVRRVPEATHHYQLAMEGAIHSLGESKLNGDKEAFHKASTVLEHVGNLYATFLASHGRKPAAEKVKSDVKELITGTAARTSPPRTR